MDKTADIRIAVLQEMHDYLTKLVADEEITRPQVVLDRIQRQIAFEQATAAPIPDLRDRHQGVLHEGASTEEPFFLILECPRVVPGLPTSGKHVGRLVACAKCDGCVFRDDAWDAACDDILKKFESRGAPPPPFVVWCYECQRKVTAERERERAQAKEKH